MVSYATKSVPALQISLLYWWNIIQIILNNNPSKNIYQKWLFPFSLVAKQLEIEVAWQNCEYFVDGYHATELITVTGDNQSYQAVKIWNTEPEQNVAFHTPF